MVFSRGSGTSLEEVFQRVDSLIRSRDIPDPVGSRTGRLQTYAASWPRATTTRFNGLDMTQLIPGNSLGFVIVDLGRLYRQAFEKAVESAGLGLTPGEIRALAYVARYEGSRQAALAERMGVEPMTLSAYLDRLEARGLIHRETDMTDRRAKVITSTEEAERIFESIRPLAMSVYEHTVDGLSEDERELAQKLMRRMRANLATDPAIVAEDEIAAK